MRGLAELWLLAPYFALFLPSLILIAGAWLIRFGDEQQAERRQLLLLIAVSVLALVLLNLSLWHNPYGRELSSSLPAFGILPPLTALLASATQKPGRIAHLWASDRWLLALLLALALVLFLLVWFADPTAFYLAAGVSAALALAALLAGRSRLGWLSLISLLCVGALALLTGGSVLILPLDLPAWLSVTLNIATAAALLAAHFLPAALLYTALQDKLSPKQGWRLALMLILAGGSLYMTYWDGVWSSAHARAFEDHLPFIPFMLNLAAGAWLALRLKGWRRIASPAYVIVYTAAAVLALIWGWRVSAFELTARRAERVDAALQEYYQAYGAYPQELSELTPRFLLYLPPPVVVRRGGWCYQGGGESYRLGYVSGKFTYFEREFFAETYAQAGEPPPGGWNCDEMVTIFAAGKIIY